MPFGTDSDKTSWLALTVALACVAGTGCGGSVPSDAAPKLPAADSGGEVSDAEPLRKKLPPPTAIALVNEEQVTLEGQLLRAVVEAIQPLGSFVVCRLGVPGGIVLVSAVEDVGFQAPSSILETLARIFTADDEKVADAYAITIASSLGPPGEAQAPSQWREDAEDCSLDSGFLGNERVASRTQVRVMGFRWRRASPGQAPQLRPGGSEPELTAAVQHWVEKVRDRLVERFMAVAVVDGSP